MCFAHRHHSWTGHRRPHRASAAAAHSPGSQLSRLRRPAYDLGHSQLLERCIKFPFLLVAIWGLRAFRNHQAFLQQWERIAYSILLVGVALVAFGSGYYHAWPDDATLFWDRLPMTLVFMSLLATAIGERISMRAGRLLLFPLIALGAGSVVVWRFSGDLRFYGIVQFYPMLALPLLLILFPPRYSGAFGTWAMIGFYGLAKLLEFFDHQIADVLSTGGHPWKHLAGATAMLCYVAAVSNRRPVTDAPEWSFPIAFENRRSKGSPSHLHPGSSSEPER
jgi:hypothetical protein